MLNKHKQYRKACAVLLAACMVAGTGSYAYAAPQATVSDAEALACKIDTDGVSEKDRKFKTTIRFESYNNADDGFNKETKQVTIGDTVFQLDSISDLKMVDSRTPERRTMEVTSDTFIKGQEESYLPQETMEQDGVTWKLSSKELVDSEIPDIVKDAVATRAYKDVENGVPIPKTIDYTYEDADTKAKIETTLPLTDSSDTKWHWVDFEFPITISNYDAEVLDLNGTEIPSDAPLIDYADQFLAMLGLDPDYYRINAIDWAGDPYEKNGIPMRNADGIGSKYVRDVNAVYSGTVTLPHQEGAAWKSVYTEELTKKNSAVYTYEANATYISTAEQTFWQKLAGLITAAYEAIIRAITEHPILAAIQFVLLAAIITWIIAKRRKQCRFNRKQECLYKRDCEHCPYYQSLLAESTDDEITNG